MSDERAAPDAGGGGDFEEPDEIEEAEIDDQGDEGAGDDEALEGDDGAEGEAGEEGARQDVAPRRPNGRRERQAAEIRLLREQNQRFERELAGIRSQQQQPRVDPAAQARAEAEEQERVRLLPPEEQIRYYRERDRREFGNALMQQQVQIQDRIDKSTFDAAARADPVRAKFAERVEGVLAAERNQGRNPDRETIFTYLYGQAALQQRQQRAGGQRTGARRRVVGQQTRPGGGRSDGVRQPRAASGNEEDAALNWLRGPG